MKVFDIIDKATGEKLMRTIAESHKQAKFVFYSTKGFGHHGDVRSKEFKKGVVIPRGCTTYEFTHRGRRSALGGKCGKCDAATHWVVMVMGRPAYWCGCD